MASSGETQRLFEHRGVQVQYWDLPPTNDHLLYGYAAWPVAELLARLLIDRSLDGSADARSRDAIPDVRHRAVLEIGAGVGLTGLACHALGAREVLLTDGEERLVHTLREKHRHLEGVSADLLDWAIDSGGQQFDVILGSDIILSICGGHTGAPRVIGSRLRRTPDARALLMSPIRKAETPAMAVQELESQGLHVSLFAVCAAGTVLSISKERLRTLAPEAVLLIVAQWFPWTFTAVEEHEECDIDGDLAELLQVEDDVAIADAT